MFDLGKLSIRQLMQQVLNLCLIGSTAFMAWKGFSLAMDCESPIVVVLSGSMEPAFQRGDLLFLSNLPKTVDIGDVVVYNIQDRSIPIVHRVIKSHISASTALNELGKPVKYVRGLVNKQKTRVNLPKGQKASVRGFRVNPFSQEDPNRGPTQKLLTKGDNNAEDDLALYAPGQRFLDRKEDVIGVMYGFMPYVGMVTLAMNDYPALRYVLLGGMGLTALISRES
jgi:signal peptidase